MLLIRNILLIHAVGIIFLHSLIPHIHHGEMTNEERNTTHEKAKGIVDYLGLAFQHGSKNNLNNYICSEQKSSTKIDLDYFLLLAGTNLTLSEVVSTSIRLHFRTQSQISFEGKKTSSNGLRAPPIHDNYS